MNENLTDFWPLRINLPKIWVGYVIAAIMAYLVYLEVNASSSVFIWITIIGVAYWFFCVYRIHNILDIITNFQYPISPSKAILGHFIPFYNIYWVFKWPNELANFVNRIVPTRGMAKGWSGIFLLLGGIMFSGVLGVVFIFGVLGYCNSKIRRAIMLLFLSYTSYEREETQSSLGREGQESESSEYYAFQDSLASEEEKAKYYGRVLNLKGKVTTENIKTSYRELIGKYHPDKVQHLGEEFQEIAKKKTKEINNAYEYFNNKYNIK